MQAEDLCIVRLNDVPDLGHRIVVLVDLQHNHTAGVLNGDHVAQVLNQAFECDAAFVFSVLVNNGNECQVKSAHQSHQVIGMLVVLDNRFRSEEHTSELQ